MPVSDSQPSAPSAGKLTDAGLPAQLVSVRLQAIRCHGDLHAFDQVGSRVVYVDSETTVHTNGTAGAMAVVEIRCRVATPAEQPEILLDCAFIHRLLYSIKAPDEAVVGFIDTNALFHAWPYARALLGDIQARMELQIPPMPLLPAGVKAVKSELTSQSEQASKASSLADTRRPTEIVSNDSDQDGPQPQQ